MHTRRSIISVSYTHLGKAVALRQSEGLKAIICPETMGKINQLGTLDEVIELCTLDDEMLLSLIHIWTVR